MRKVLLLLLIVNTVQAQRSHKGDKKIVSALKSHIEFLSDDKLEGRRTGSAGELLAAEYISEQLKKMGLETQIQEFPVSEKRIAERGSELVMDGKSMVCDVDFFPLAISASGSLVSSFSLSLPESGTPWFMDISDLIKEEAKNVHADLSGDIKKSAEDIAKRGATALFLYDSRTDGMKLPSFSFDKKDSVKIPVVYLGDAAMALLKKDSIGFHDVSLICKMTASKRVGRNVFGVIWNKAAETVILGAHFDHLGYGEDKNTLFTGKELLVHNGADDNASGVAALIELAKIIKAGGLKKYNYIFVAFSGEELGLFGSKYFADHLPEKTGRVNYMINMDMVGRLNDSSKTITIGGYGTSPRWADLLEIKGNPLRFKYDSSGTGPSDHTSFYRKNIPVLFFFTGLHSDYHKPSDDAEKINYEGEKDIIRLVETVVKGAEKMEPLVFTKTREKAESTKTSFRITLGIMPDYTYSEAGVRVDGVSEGRPAQKAGLRAGDIILQLGSYAITDLQKYMEALGRFNAGDKTTVTVRRGKDTLQLDIAF